MRAHHSEPDLLVLRRLAEDLAHSRKERTTSGHLLAAIVSSPSQAAELLLERKLGADTLLKAARATTDEEPNPLSRAVQRAREISARMGTTGPAGPSAIHLLLALIHDRKNGAHRALAQCGVDVSRLRAAAMQLALGRIGPRRSQERETEVRPVVERVSEVGTRGGSGVKVSLLPRPKPLCFGRDDPPHDGPAPVGAGHPRDAAPIGRALDVVGRAPCFAPGAGAQARAHDQRRVTVRARRQALSDPLFAWAKI